MRWQRTINAALCQSKLTHAQFLVLDATERAVRARDDAVSQRDMAAGAGLDESTTSRIAARLNDRGLIDRGISGGGDERPWRVLVTTRGEETLREARALVASAAERFFAK